MTDIQHVQARQRIDIDPVAQADQPCPKCGQKAWKRELRQFQGNTSHGFGNMYWFEPYEWLQWTCWTCGYSFETNTLEDYRKDREP